MERCPNERCPNASKLSAPLAPSPDTTSPVLLAVPNVSEGRDDATVCAIADAFASAGGARMLDIHSDPDHHRSVFTLAGRPGLLADALLCGAREAVQRIDVVTDTNALDGGTERGAGSLAAGRRQTAGAGTPGPRGQHPHVGALDVAPIVYPDLAARGAAIAEALVLADRIAAELAVPVFLYGELAGADGRSATTRAELRSGGVAGLAQRIAAGEARPDFGPARLHPTAGATLVAAREPLVAFNLQLAQPATLADAHAIAAAIREGGAEGLPGVRAIAVELGSSGGGRSVAQVSMNVERPLEVPLATVVKRVRAHAPVASAELVGLAPAAALAGFPPEVTLVGFDPERHLLERALGSSGSGLPKCLSRSL